MKNPLGPRRDLRCRAGFYVSCKKYVFGCTFCAKIYTEILYLIFDYPHKHYTFKYFEV